MIYIIIKVAVSAILITAISEVAKRSSLAGGLLASLPFVSILAMIWLYVESKDPGKVVALSRSIFWLVLPSLVLFLVLPVMLKRGVNFWGALAGATAIMLATYGAMLVTLARLGIRL